MAETELHKRNRAKKRHKATAVEVKEPPMTRKGLLAHPGSILIGVAGMLFLAYVFNAGGMQTALDGLLGGVDASARSQGSAVTKYFLFVLPFAAILIFAGIFYIVLSAAGRMVMSPVKEKRKKRAKAAAKHARAQALAKAGVQVEETEGRVLIRPVRLAVKDRGVTKTYAART